MHRVCFYSKKLFSITVFTCSAIIFLPFALLAGESSYGTTGAPSALETVIPDHIIFVNTQHQDANDGRQGFDMERPLKTIGKASEIALKNYQRGFITKVVIYPGVYRENIKMGFKRKNERAAIIFEAKNPGTVVVSGSEVWTNWKKIKEGKKHTYLPMLEVVVGYAF